MSGAGRWLITISILILAGCSKPGEVISSRIAEANQKREAGKAEDAVKMLERLNNSYPDQAMVLEALGFAYSAAGRNGAAAASWVRAADLDRERSSLRHFAAEAYMRDGAPDRAAEQYRVYLGEFPGDFQSWQKVGEIEEQRGNIARAIDAYLEWYRIRPDGEAAYRLGTAFRKLDNTPQAKAWFEATIKQGEVHLSDALLGLLEIERDAGDFAAAERTVGQLDRVFPGVLAASPLASVRAQIAEWKESERKIAEARADQEKLAHELEESRRRAQNELNAAATSTPAPATAVAAATAQAKPEKEKSGDETAAPAAATTAATPETRPQTKPSPGMSPALVAAIGKRNAGETDKAIEILWRALGQNAQQVALWKEMADCYFELKQYEQAESCMLEARRLDPESLEIETAYLNVMHESQPMEKYLDAVEEARKKFPDNANFAYVFAHGLANGNGTRQLTVAAYEDFLLVADANDPRRAEATEYIARSRRR